MSLPQHDGRFHEDGCIDNRQVAANADIAVSKLDGGSDGQVLKTVSGVPTWAAESGGGADELNDLSDVAISSPASGQVVRYNGSAFVNAAIQAGDLPTGIDAAKLGAGGVSNTELGYLDGVTSAIQTQIDGKAASSHSHNASAITAGTLDAARLPTGIDAANIGGGGVSSTEFGYLDGVTSGIQSQLNGKQANVTPIQEEPSGTKDGSNDEFTLTVAPTWGTLVWEGVSLRWGVDFELDGTTITILTTEKPESGDDLWFSGLAV
jgi:hypothetical protein